MLKQLRKINLGPVMEFGEISLKVGDSSSIEKALGKSPVGNCKCGNNKIVITLNTERGNLEKLLYCILPHEIRHAGDYLQRKFKLEGEALALFTGSVNWEFSKALRKYYERQED